MLLTSQKNIITNKEYLLIQADYHPFRNPDILQTFKQKYNIRLYRWTR